MAKFLETWVDSGLPDDPDWSIESETAKQLERVGVNAAVMQFLTEIPTRLPESAGRVARSHDKKLAKQVLNRMKIAARAWGVEKSPALEQFVDGYKNETTHGIAMRLLWPNWWDTHRTTLQAGIKRVATNAYRTDEIAWGNRQAHALLNEYNALNDLVFKLPTH